MKYLITALFLCGCCSVASAQFTIRKIEPHEVPTVSRPEQLIPTEIKTEYYSRARADYERRQQRRQRNTFEFSSSLHFSQSSYDNWAAGGDNTVAIKSTIFFRHLYKTDRFSIENKFDARYGINRADGKTYKNEDEFKYNLLVSWKIRDAWSYASTVGFRSQFVDGFKSRTNETLVSAFMAPAYLDVSVGFNYRNDRIPLNITISPIGGQFTFVLDSTLSAQGKFGVEKNKHLKKNAGPSLKVDFNKTFGGKNKDIFHVRSNLYCFSNLGNTSQVRWENWLDIKATKWLSTSLYAQFYFEDQAKTPMPKKIQSRYTMSLGLSYKFKSK